ncbi:MAG: hypothetical protein JXA71_19055 [Chitinispirillaceae bacterium]|nr:hypothetical protein [Chitinispirillaceae bacterium]
MITTNQASGKNDADLVHLQLFLTAQLNRHANEEALFSMIADEFRKNAAHSVLVMLMTDDRKKLKLKAASAFEQVRGILKISTRNQTHDIVLKLNETFLFRKIINNEKTLTEKASAVIHEFRPDASPAEIKNIAETVGYSDKQCIISPIMVSGKSVGVIAVITPVCGDECILSCRCFAEKLSIALEKVAEHAEQELLKSRLKISQELLLAERNELKEKNLALMVVLQEIEAEKKEIATHFLTNVEKVLIPLVERMEKNGDVANRGHLSLLKRNLKEIASPFHDRLSSKYTALSPRELDVCFLLKNGMTSKEIAEHLVVAPQTVHRFREHIRKKLGIANKEVNLTAFLKSEAFNKLELSRSF